MNKIEQWILRRIIRKAVTQGAHAGNIIELYKTIRIACEDEFYEDNLTTLNSNLTHWFECSLRRWSK